MKTVLIYYGTREGQTARIGECIAETLVEAGFGADLVRADDRSARFESDEYAGVVLGAAIHYGKLPKEFRREVLAHRSELAKVPCAFFSVCLGVLEKDNPETQAAEKKIVSDFLAEARLSPALVDIFPGALKYSEYGWLKRKALRAIARKAGVETSFDRDCDFTDWDRVRLFARSFAETLECAEESFREFPRSFSATTRPSATFFGGAPDRIVKPRASDLSGNGGRPAK